MLESEKRASSTAVIQATEAASSSAAEGPSPTSHAYYNMKYLTASTTLSSLLSSIHRDSEKRQNQSHAFHASIGVDSGHR